MSESEKQVVVEYCEKMDKRHQRLTNILYTLLTLMAGGVVFMLISFGEVKGQAAQVDDKVDRSEFDMVSNKIEEVGKKVDVLNKSVGSLEGMMQEHTRTSR